MKYINFKRYKFSTLWKKIDFKRYNLIKIFKKIDLNRYFVSKIYKILDYKSYNFSKIFKKISITKRSKSFLVYFSGALVFIFLIYLTSPLFFKYNESLIKNTLCKDLNIKCTIKGKVSYSVFPSPRLKIKNITIKDFVEKGKVFAAIESVVLKISIYDLLQKKQFQFHSIKLKGAKINVNMQKISDYKNFLKKKFIYRPITSQKGEINFFDNEKQLATINNTTIELRSNNNKNNVTIKGDFLNDEIYINFTKNKKENEENFIIKFLESKSLAEIKILNSESNKNKLNGNILFKKNKNRIRSNFTYENNAVIFKAGDIRNDFNKAKFDGEVKFLPFFDFNLNIDLLSLNFKRLYNHLVALSEVDQKNLFKINKKINGKINLSARKIYSSYELINSFETRVRLTNGNIAVEQLLLNLGKLGAADLTGIIDNDKKFTNFKFENNIFIDNQKRFNRKFSIYNEQAELPSLFVSGNFDLENFNMHFHEISTDKKIKEADVEYIQKEFNNILLEDGYTSLFNFPNFKEFVKAITAESN
mgnify:CR=1 FL=1